MEHRPDGTEPAQVAALADARHERGTAPDPAGTAAQRRGPSVDLDPTGIVTAKIPDRQRRQFLNYSFYRLDPVFRRLPADEQRHAAGAFIEMVHRWESLEDVILRTYSLVGLR